MQSTKRVGIDNEILTMPQRWLGLITDALMLLLLAFFAFHQWKITGFFTSKFGWIEMLALYVPILMSLVAPVQRFILGKRNPARPIEALSDLCLAIGPLWLQLFSRLTSPTWRIHSHLLCVFHLAGSTMMSASGSWFCR